MKKIAILIIGCCICFSACENRSKYIYASEVQPISVQISESSITTPVIEKSVEKNINIKKNKDYDVVKLLSKFACEPRRLGEDGERNAAKFIINKLTVCGWQAREEKFPVYRYKDVISEPYTLKTDGAEFMGNGINVVAELPNYDNEKGTIILSAHYDTTKDNIGIIDNGSGTTFLLTAAEMLSKAELDFNIRLVFFDMEEYSMYGSKYYLANMTDKQRGSIIANINFDMLGGNPESLKIATSNGLESALEIYLNDICGNKYDLSAKGMHSDSNGFMHWQIPAVTFIDESLPLDLIESEEHINFLSNKAFNNILSDLTLIINNFDVKEFEKIKYIGIETEYNDKSVNAFSDVYRKMTSLNISDFKLNRCYSKVYYNGISAYLCCEYICGDGRKFVVKTISEIKEDDSFNALDGIPTFEDCKAAAGNGEILVDEMLNYKIIGELSDDELKAIWNYLH